MVFFLVLRRGAFFDGDFESEQHAGELAAGGDFNERLERLAGVGGDAVFDRVPAGGGPCGFLIARRDGDLELDLHGERIDLRFGEFGEFGCGGFALGGESGGGFAVFRGGLFEIGAKGFEDFVAVFDFGEFRGDIFPKCNDLGDGLAVFSFEPIDEGKAVFDFGEALGRGVDAFGVVAESGGDIGDGGAG